MSGSTKYGARPPLACEIAADRVLAGRSADAGRMVEMCSARELAPGTGATARPSGRRLKAPWVESADVRAT